MNRLRSSRLLQATALLAGALACVAAAVVRERLGSEGAPSGQWVSQSFTLRPGWNAVYLEVRPEPADPASLFAGVPVESVFTRTPEAFGAEFIEDPGEQIVRDPGWMWYFRDAPQSATNTLFALQANRAYLVKLAASAPPTTTWTLSGRPEVERIRWAPDAFTLTGLPVDATAPPTFEEFFAPSAAHAGQPVYSLTGGAWQAVDADTPVRSGEAYWVRTAGSSAYGGTFDLEIEGTDGLDYDETLEQAGLQIRNLAASGNTVTIRQLSSTNEVPLAYSSFDANSSELVWLDLSPSTPRVLSSLEAGAVRRETLAVRRARLAAGVDTAESVLQITDAVGTRRWVPVVALRAGTGTSSLATSRPQNLLARAWEGVLGATPPAHPGLWVGQATITEVNRSTDPTSFEATAQEFSFRLIVHVDRDGQARLLRQVIQGWQDGTLGPNGAVETPGRYVLLTDDALVSSYLGTSLRDGVLASHRISTAAFNFAGQQLDMTGTMDFGSSLNLTIEVEPELPTHPFRHKYHPDHDDLNAKYDGPAAEIYPYRRELTLAFDANDPTGSRQPGWGDSVLGGTYSERIPAIYQADPDDPDLPKLVSGLHENDLQTRGRFLLTRISLVDELNPTSP